MGFDLKIHSLLAFHCIPFVALGLSHNESEFFSSGYNLIFESLAFFIDGLCSKFANFGPLKSYKASGFSAAT